MIPWTGSKLLLCRHFDAFLLFPQMLLFRTRFTTPANPNVCSKFAMARSAIRNVMYIFDMFDMFYFEVCSDACFMTEDGSDGFVS